MIDRLHEILNREDTRTGRVANWLISGLIILSVASLALETFEVSSGTRKLLGIAEVIFVGLFTIEWLLRLCTAPLMFPRRPVVGAARGFILSPLSIIDLLAIVPFYLALLFPVQVPGLLAVRALRLTRLLKLGRYSTPLQRIVNVFVRKKGELFVTAYISLIVLFVISILMYYAEHEAQPDKFGNIIDGLWWGIATLTTVGYGDIFPVTVMGKGIAAVSAFVGIGVFALPTAILGAAFLEEVGSELND